MEIWCIALNRSNTYIAICGKLFKLLLGDSLFCHPCPCLSLEEHIYPWKDVDVVMLRGTARAARAKISILSEVQYRQGCSCTRSTSIRARSAMRPLGYTSWCFVFCNGRKKLLFGGIRMLISVSMFSRRGNKFHSRIFASKRQKLFPWSKCWGRHDRRANGNFLLQYVSIIFCQTFVHVREQCFFCHTLLFVLKARAGTLMRRPLEEVWCLSRSRKKCMELIITGLFWVDSSLTLNSGFAWMVW